MFDITVLGDILTGVGCIALVVVLTLNIHRRDEKRKLARKSLPNVQIEGEKLSFPQFSPPYMYEGLYQVEVSEQTLQNEIERLTFIKQEFEALIPENVKEHIVQRRLEHRSSEVWYTNHLFVKRLTELLTERKDLYKKLRTERLYLNKQLTKFTGSAYNDK